MVGCTNVCECFAMVIGTSRVVMLWLYRYTVMVDPGNGVY